MKALVLLSGGVDSSTALAMALEECGKGNVLALCTFYGQKHDKEIEAAKKVADYYDVELLIVNLKKIFEFSESSLLKGSAEEIPKKSYAAQRKEDESQNLVSTYVPFRNGLFLSVAAAVALSKDCNLIYYGPHRDDTIGAAYPDCTEEFNNAMKKAIYEGSGKSLEVKAPFINMTKAQIVKKGLELKVPYELTWSCYEGGESPCGECATCIDRRIAFEANGKKDPLYDLKRNS